MEVNKDNEKEEDKKEEVVVPNIVGMTIEEAEQVLHDKGLVLDIGREESIDKKVTRIKEQLPTAGITVYKETKIAVTIL